MHDLAITTGQVSQRARDELVIAISTPSGWDVQRGLSLVAMRSGYELLKNLRIQLDALHDAITRKNALREDPR